MMYYYHSNGSEKKIASELYDVTQTLFLPWMSLWHKMVENNFSNNSDKSSLQILSCRMYWISSHLQ